MQMIKEIKGNECLLFDIDTLEEKWCSKESIMQSKTFVLGKSKSGLKAVGIKDYIKYEISAYKLSGINVKINFNDDDIVLESVTSSTSTLYIFEVPYGVTIVGGAYEVKIPSSKSSVSQVISRPRPRPVYTSCFMGFANLRGVKLPPTVKRIGNYCFAGCTSLSNIEIPDSVVKLGYNCFRGCTSLTTLRLPDSLVEFEISERRPRGVFQDCSWLKHIKLPSTLKELGRDFFKGCSDLQSIEIPESVTSIDIGCFEGCTSLQSIEIPESVISIGDSCFAGCTSLTSVKLPSSLTELEDSCFKGCLQLKSIKLPKGITSLYPCCFEGCTALETIILPDGLIELCSSCFSGCTNLKGLVLPKSIKVIGHDCFSRCTGLCDSNFTLPISVEKLNVSCIGAKQRERNKQRGFRW